MSDEKKKSTTGRNFLVSSFWAIPVIYIVCRWWPEVLPVKSAFEYWTPKGSVFTWLFAAWPIFVWAIGINALSQLGRIASKPKLMRLHDRIMGDDEPTGTQVLIAGTLTSLWAGVVEEIAFRWLLFFSAIVGVTVTNFLFFGFLGFGIPEWFYMNIAGPVVNWLSFGYLQPLLFHSAGWQVGAGLLSANAFFRDGHKYQGLLGFVNSWFLGLFFFWMMFQYGLVAAIVVHFTYDFLIFATAAAAQFYKQRAL